MAAPEFREEITPHNKLKYTTAIAQVYQSMGSLLRPHLTVVSEMGEAVTGVDLFAKATARRDGTAFRTNPELVTPRERVWYAPNPAIEWGEPIEREDIFRQCFDPESNLLKAGGMAISRFEDQDILAGMFGPRKTGKDFASVTTEAFPPEQIAPIGLGSPDGTTPTGMNLEKLRFIRRFFRRNHVTMMGEKPCVAVSADQIEDLSRFVEVTSADYFKDGEEAYYRSGTLKGVMGVEFVDFEDCPVRVETIDTEDYSIQDVPAWIKSGVQLGEWQAFWSDMWPLPDKRNIPYVYATEVIGVTRLQKETVLKLPCVVKA